MHFGLSVCSETARWRDTVAQVRLAEELGYDSVWLPEHHLIEGYLPNPLLALAALVEITHRLQLGTDVLLGPFYHPVRLAEDIGQFVEMSEGRLLFGIGLGYRPEEFAAYGIPYKERGGRLDEGLQLIRRLWTEEHVSFQGRYFVLDDVTIYPRIQHQPPLWIGGWAESALKRAARYGDAWFPGPTANLSKLRDCLKIYDEALAQQGRVRTALPVFREVWVADTRQRLDAGLEALQALYQADYLTWKHQNVDSIADLTSDRFIVGDPETVAQHIIRLHREIGMTHLVARLHFQGMDEAEVENAMRLLITVVRPLVEKELIYG